MKEYHFNFRGESIGVEAESLEGAYGYFYSTYSSVSEAELDEAYSEEEKWKWKTTEKRIGRYIFQ